MRKIATLFVSLLLVLTVFSVSAFAYHQPKNTATRLATRITGMNTYNSGSQFSDSNRFMMWSGTFTPGQEFNFIFGEFGISSDDGSPLLIASQWHRGIHGKLTKTADLTGTFDPVEKTFQGDITPIGGGEPLFFQGSYSQREDGFIDWIAGLLDGSGTGLVFE